MKQKKQRIDTSAEVTPLTHNPFGVLMPGQAAPVPAPDAPATAPVAQRGWRVEKTRKGGWPLSMEKRGGGKVVTVLRVSGDREGLLKELKRLCGAGGALREEGLEIQGEHRARIEMFLSGS